MIDPKFPVRSDASNSEVLKSHMAPLYLGKNDFDAIDSLRGKVLFICALGLGAVPSSPPFRQPVDTLPSSRFDVVPQMNQQLFSSRVNGLSMDFGALSCGYTSMDLDTFVIDNGGTKKKLVGRTHSVVDGYFPCAVYLAGPGYCLEFSRQNNLNEPDAQVYQKAKRWPIKAVILDLMFKAARKITHTRQWALGTGASDPALAVLERHYRQMNTT